MEEFIQEFKAEANGILQRLQEQLMLLEHDKKNKLLIEEIFRGMHTLKGSSRMFGFDKIERITHNLENTFDLIRSEKLVASSQVVELSLQVVDICASLLAGVNDDARFQEVLAKLGAGEVFKKDNAPASAAVYQVLYYPAANVFDRGVNPLAVIQELKDIGPHLIIDLNRNAPALDTQINNKRFESIFEVLVSFPGSRDVLDDVFIFLDNSEFEIHEVSALTEISDVLARAQARATSPLSEEVIQQQKDFVSAHLVEKVSLQDVKEEQSVPNNLAIAPEDSGLQYINVRLDRLDDMMNLVSELVTIKAELQYRSSYQNDTALVSAVERLEKVTTRFRDNAFNMRLVPLQVLALKFQRIVRDLGPKLGKQINLLTEGLDTEIDKTIIHEIEAPLMHIIRNAIDHGLETSEERAMLGKDKKGLLKIVAFYSGANVFIQIQDDGRGLDLAKIRAKAISKGIISANANLSDHDIINLIFEPGFSTASATTETSGRGVGLDVVRHKLKELRGSIEITTEEGLGTAFSIRLPLSLSIMDVLHVKVNEVNYLLPHNEVESCLSQRLNSDQIERRGSNVKYRGSLVPYVELRKLQESLSAVEPSEPCVIVMNKNDQHIALEVDSIIGEEQLVIKPIDDALSKVEYLSGVAVLGNGELAFLIDSLKLKQKLSIERQSVRIIPN